MKPSVHIEKLNENVNVYLLIFSSIPNILRLVNPGDRAVNRIDKLLCIPTLLSNEREETKHKTK